jgi:phage terminase small subunit
MPILKNVKHELMAQGLAEGKSQEKAYIEAGFSPNAARANAATLIKRNRSILTRRNELMSQREALQTRAMVAAAKTAQITLESHLSKLAEIRDLAIAAEDYSAANTAETNRGKVMGYYVERKEVGRPGDFSNLSDEELRAKREMYEAIARAKTVAPVEE